MHAARTVLRRAAEEHDTFGGGGAVLDAAPGLTCIWQVSGRGDIPFPEQVQLDSDYIDNRSLWLDIKLLMQTVPAVFTGKGAY